MVLFDECRKSNDVEQDGVIWKVIIDDWHRWNGYLGT